MESHSKLHSGHVGTERYMAPEVIGQKKAHYNDKVPTVSLLLASDRCAFNVKDVRSHVS
jgi:serine/threonine protein kinase